MAEGVLCVMRQILEPVQEARMVVDAHPYIVNAYALCIAVAEAAGADAAPAAPLAALLAEDHPPSWSPLPPDSTFRALHAGEIRLHQGAAHLLVHLYRGASAQGQQTHVSPS